MRENRKTFAAADITREDPFQVHTPVGFISAYVGVPLLDGNKLLGVLFALEADEPRRLNPDEMDFLIELAYRATVAIARAQHYHQLTEANRLLQKQNALLQVRCEQLIQAKTAEETPSHTKSEFLAESRAELRAS
jgi:GAF domain-containing protein